MRAAPSVTFAGDELDAAQRALVVEQDARGSVQAEALAVVHRHPVGVELGHRIGAARIEGRRLALHRLLDQPVHLARRGLVEAGLRGDEAHRLQHVVGAQRGDLPCQQRLAPGGLHEGLGPEIVDLIRLHLLQDAQQGGEVEQVAVHHPDLPGDAQPAQPLVHHVRRGGASHQAIDLVALLEQVLGEIGAVLARDPGDERSGHGPRLGKLESRLERMAGR